MAETIHWSAVDGICIVDTGSKGYQPGIPQDSQLHLTGNVNNLSGNQTANQMYGCVALPAIAAGTTGTVVVTNGLPGGTAYIFLTAVNNPGAAVPSTPGDTTAGRGMEVWLESITNGTSFTIGYRPAALMAAAWNCFYIMFNS